VGPYPGRNELTYSDIDERDSRLIAAREAHPGYDIYRVMQGYLAVPAGTPVYVASSVDGIVGKLRYRESSG